MARLNLWRMECVRRFLPDPSLWPLSSSLQLLVDKEWPHICKIKDKDMRDIRKYPRKYAQENEKMVVRRAHSPSEAPSSGVVLPSKAPSSGVLETMIKGRKRKEEDVFEEEEEGRVERKSKKFKVTVRARGKQHLVQALAQGRRLRTI
jgi:hypothetical protein